MRSAEPLPAEMRVLELRRPEPDLQRALAGLTPSTRPLPKPAAGEVLVRVAAAACNPSDLVFLRGQSHVAKPMPAVPGWEGCGRVVAAGPGLLGRVLLGRRVACGGGENSDGTWAEYFLTEAHRCLPLDSGISDAQGAALLINPLTAWCFLRLARQGRHRALIQTAAASQLGRLILQVAERAGLATLNIVRRPEQAEALRVAGARHILVSTAADFPGELRRLSHSLGATLVLDAVAGSLTGQLVNAAPPRSTVLVFGQLSDEPVSGIEPQALLLEGKIVSGFFLGDWLARASLLQRATAAWQVRRWAHQGLISGEVRESVSLAEAPAAIGRYRSNMSAGKILICPSRPASARADASQ